MSKKPVLRRFDLPTEDQSKAVESSIDELRRSAPVQIQDKPLPKKKGGRPRKYTGEPIKRTILVPTRLNEALLARAELEAAGNVTAIVLRALEEYLGIKVDK